MLGILFAASALAAPRLTLAGGANAGMSVALSFAEDVPGAVLLAGCGTVELERFWGGAWIPAPGPRCEAAVPAIVVDGALTVSAVVPQPGTWRAVLAWGGGCVSGRPFSLSGCTTLAVVRSESFDAE